MHHAHARLEAEDREHPRVDGAVPADQLPTVKSLMIRVVDTLQNTIGIIDFWKKPIEVKKLRGNIDTEILLAGIRRGLPSAAA